MTKREVFILLKKDDLRHAAYVPHSCLMRAIDPKRELAESGVANRSRRFRPSHYAEADANKKQ
jgi:hypothetical protein